MKLLASLDGITMDHAIICEVKSWNIVLVHAVQAGDLPDSHWPQVEQQLLVTGAKEALFVVSDGTEENTAFMWYASRPERRQRLVAGWKQFAADLKAYKSTPPAEPVQEVIAAPIKQLPALSIQVQGSIALASNLEIFGAKLREFISNIIKEPKDDQDFADAEAAVKTLKKAEEALEQAETAALSQTASIDEMRSAVALNKELARSARLMLSKIVEQRKATIRLQIMQAGQRAFAAHVQMLERRIGMDMPEFKPDFAGAMKGKKTVTSLRDAVEFIVANAKIAANEVADCIEINLKRFSELAAGYEFLFADRAQLALKSADDFEATIKLRIVEHKESQAKKEEAERERIRAEEVEREEKLRIERAEKEWSEHDKALTSLVEENKLPLLTIPGQHRRVVLFDEHGTNPSASPTPSRADALFMDELPVEVQRAIVQHLCTFYRVDRETVIRWLRAIVQAEAAAEFDNKLLDATNP